MAAYNGSEKSVDTVKRTDPALVNSGVVDAVVEVWKGTLGR